jgi:hypothetical protein
MGRKLEWELSGKSDVPEKMAKAKASMEGLEGAANGLSKKFKEAFKDIAVGFVAPMVLVQKTLGFISDQFQRIQQFAADSISFAKEADSIKYFGPGAREAILQNEARAKESEDRLKGVFGSQIGYATFLAKDPRGQQMMREAGKTPAAVTTGAGPFSFLNPIISALAAGAQSKASAQMLATDPEVRAKIDALLAEDIARRTAAEAAAATSATSPTAQKMPELSSNVIGVGMSPQLDVANKQLAVQEDMANSLRTMIERDQAQTGFTPEKFFPSARRLNLPR